MPLSAAETCLRKEIAKAPNDIPDFAHVDEAPSFNRARQEAITAWWQTTCPEFREQNVPRFREDNLICRIPGESDQLIVIGAHFDKVGVGKGVADNWSGIVLIDAVLKHVVSSGVKPEARPKYTLEFVAFAAEEDGLYGSKEYVKQLDAPVVAMINLDTIGLTNLVIAGRSDPTLICQTEAVADALNIRTKKRIWKDISSDWERFTDRDMPAIGLHSVTNQTRRRIHHRRDKPGNVTLRYLDEAYQLTLVLLDQYLGD